MAELTIIEQIGQGIAYNGKTVGQIRRYINRSAADLTLSSNAEIVLSVSPMILVPGASVELFWNGRQFIQIDKWPDTTSGTSLTPEDYGAIGDGVTDDGAALQAAITAAFVLKKTLQFAGKTYCTSIELDNPGIKMVGQRGAGPTVIQALGAITSVMKLTGVTFMLDFTIDGGGIALHAIRFLSASYSVLDCVKAYNTVSDGLWVDNVSDGSDSVLLRNCMTQSCGTIYRSHASLAPLPSSGAHKVVLGSGTVSTTSGSQVITASGFPVGTNFNTMRARRGDFIVVANGPSALYADCEIFCIGSVAGDGLSVTCSKYRSSARTASGKHFTLLVGDGLRQEVSGDANNWLIQNHKSLNVAGCATSFAGLWGPRIDQIQSDAHGAYLARIGSSSPTDLDAAPINTRITGIYAEGYPEMAQYAVFGVGFNGLDIEDVKFAGGAFYTDNPSLGFGYTKNVQSDPQAIRAIGDDSVNYILSSRIYRATVQGQLVSTPVALSLANLAATMTVTNVLLGYMSAGTGLAQNHTATPTFSAGAEGQILMVSYTDTTGSIRLQDESVRPNTNLKLAGAADAVLKRRDLLMLMYIDGKWCELARVITP